MPGLAQMGRHTKMQNIATQVPRHLEIVWPPEHAHIVGSKWGFHYKLDLTGKIVKYNGQMLHEAFCKQMA